MFKYLVDSYISGSKTNLFSLIQTWIAGESVLQNIDNPSGLARAGGLGEPKFELNLTVSAMFELPPLVVIIADSFLVSRLSLGPGGEFTFLSVLGISVDGTLRSRPQRDGPGLRATTIIKFGNYLLDRHQDTSYVSGTLWPIVELVSRSPLMVNTPYRAHSAGML